MIPQIFIEINNQTASDEIYVEMNRIVNVTFHANKGRPLSMLYCNISDGLRTEHFGDVTQTISSEGGTYDHSMSFCVSIQSQEQTLTCTNTQKEIEKEQNISTALLVTGEESNFDQSSHFFFIVDVETVEQVRE